MNDTPDISGMLSTILQNPNAKNTLMSLLGSGEEEVSEAPPPAEPEETEAVYAQLEAPAGHRHGSERKKLLLALRPYLGTRRSHALDRLIRAMELFDLIENTKHLKGGL